MFIDAISRLVRDGQVISRPVYVAIGVTLNGEGDVLGLWAAGDGSEGAKFWLSVLTESKNRGVEDVCITVGDGLKWSARGHHPVRSLAVVQTCIVQLVRKTYRYAALQYWDGMSRELRLVYAAPSEAAAKERFVKFSGKWGKQHPAIIRLWENAWSHFVPFLDYDVEIRRVTCSTNAVESSTSQPGH